VCQLNFSGVCRGCGRSLEEIAEWPIAGEARRRAIREAARKRRRELKKKAAR
jgi:predicted Fe-S protein YdhL (DUF1289 family)